MPARLAELEPGSFAGEAARYFEIVSDSGFRATFNAVGARLMTLEFPDGFDVVAGPARIEDVLESEVYAGAICGRFANRIEKGLITIDGTAHQLTVNEPPNHLHGGVEAFHRKNWVAEIIDDALVFSLVSPNREEGYPGKLRVRCTYRFDGDTLSCEIEATTKKTTVVNLTNHVYWNLSGAEIVADHALQISAQAYTPTNAELIPSGAVSFVSGTNYDFREPAFLEEAFADGSGFDGNFCLEGERHTLHHAASLEAGGRAFDLFTTEPGLQLYTAGHWGPNFKGKKSEGLRRFGAVALEPQNWPDAPNQPNFPSALLKPGETYRHHIEWRFRKG